MKIWTVSMECAGIAEAGGVKNVAFSLCKEFSELKHKVTLFIPVFKCTCLDALFDFQKLETPAEVELCGKKEAVYYTLAKSTAGFDVVLVNHPLFAEKEAVLWYKERLSNYLIEKVKSRVNFTEEEKNMIKKYSLNPHLYSSFYMWRRILIIKVATLFL